MAYKDLTWPKDKLGESQARYVLVMRRKDPKRPVKYKAEVNRDPEEWWDLDRDMHPSQEVINPFPDDTYVPD